MSGVKPRSALPRVLLYWVARDSVSCFTIRAHGMSQPGHCLSLCFSKSVERPLSAVAAPDLELSVANDFHFDIIRVVVWTKLPAFCYRQSREENDIFFDIANIDQPSLIPCLIIGEPVDNGLFCIEHFQNQALTAALRIKPVRRVAWLDGNGDRKSTRLNSSHVAISY